MLKAILNIWKRAIEFGFSENHTEENELIRSYNIMTLITISGIIPIILLAIWVQFSQIYIIIVLAILFIYIFVLISNYFGKIYIARYIISIGSPLWHSVTSILIGGYFCQGAGVISSMAITYVAFQSKKKIRNILQIFHVVAYFSSILFVNNFGPIFGVIDFPYDEVIVFLGSLGWSIIMLHTFNKDRSELLKNLKTNNEELVIATEELERFSYIASHDLKSPLRTIISFIGLIERDIDKQDFENFKENLSFIKSGAEQMNFLVQDILELSKLNNFEYTTRTEVDLNKIYEKAQHNLINDITEKNALVRCEHLPTFNCNELEFLLLFQNFIQNAIKYNESEPPEIIISSYKKNDKLHLLFSDNGIGIDEEYYEQIFQYFKRLHTSEKYQGTGLGLGLCNKIISNYNGEINIKSKINVGTTFEIVFPN